MSTIRLDKYLADAGIGTRTQIKTYIRKGLVSVNGARQLRPEFKICIGEDTITFNDNEIKYSEFEYYLLNKPAGYVSATTDNVYPTVMSLIDSRRRDLFPVGRLDKDTEGLLLITNDGELSHRLLSPRHHIDKTYYAVLDGPVGEHEADLFAAGLEIGDDDLDVAMPALLEILPGPLEFVSSYYNEVINNSAVHDSAVCDSAFRCKASEPPTYDQEEKKKTQDKATPHDMDRPGFVLITIEEGKYHQVKRMFQKVGRRVIYLRRISMGNLTLPDNLEPGQYIPIDISTLAI